MLAYAKTPEDRRRELRLPVRLTAHCQIGTRYVRDPLGDLSLDGLFLRTNEPASEGTAVKIALALPYSDGPRFCTLAGRVVRAERALNGARLGLAIEFDETTSEFDRQMLRGFLALWGGRRLARA